MVVGCHSRQKIDYNPFRNLIALSEHRFIARYIVADQNIQATYLYSVFGVHKMMLIRPILQSIFLLAATQTIAAGHNSMITYQIGDNEYKAFVAEPEGTASTTVYIIHDWNGLDDYEIGRARMLAEQGYRAVALDLFGVDAKLDGFDDYRRETGKLYKDRLEFRTRISKGIEATSKGTVRNILAGYCFGGAAVLEGARAGFPLDGFVSFHGGLSTPQGQDYSNTQGRILLLHGSADPVSGMDDLAGLLNELTEAGVEHTARVYGGARHSFTVQGSRDYLEEADKKSWQAFLEFLTDNS